MSTALVLGGGGPVGMAWEFGVLSGIARSGVDLRGIVDLTVGTSAGSAVGVWFLSDNVSDEDVIGRLGTLGKEVFGLMSQLPAPSSVSGSQTTPTGVMDAMAKSGADLVASNRAIGQAVLDTSAIPEDAYVSVIERLVGTEWPSAFVCPGTNIESGELEIWDHRSGVPLGRAIAAACAWPGAFPSVTIDGHVYIDGGVQNGMNAQLAAGYDTVIGISVMPLADGSGVPAGMARNLRHARESLGALESQGTSVILVEPDSRFLTISEYGAALMDTSRVGEAHAAGVDLGAEVAKRIANDQTPNGDTPIEGRATDAR